MKIFTTLLKILVFSSLSLSATSTCTGLPTTEDISSPAIIHTAGAVEIANLKGEDCFNETINKFKIISLPNSSLGILYMADGVTRVSVGQVLSLEEANGLKFDPDEDCIGDASFTYASIDSRGSMDDTPATVSLPITLGSTCSEAPTSDDVRNTNIVNTSDAVEIVGLGGTDCAGGDIEKFKIITLPDPLHGKLYLPNGTAVTVGQLLTEEEANSLKFDPVAGFVGDASFTYLAIDGNNVEDPTAATVTIPVVGAGGGGACTEAPSSADVSNGNILNSLDAVNIVNLAGTDCSGADVEKFEITTLPNASAGVLYMADGVTAVTVGQTLTREEADGLKFDPVAGFVGDASFTYSAIDGNNVKDPTPATVTIPVVAGGGGACTEAPTSDDVSNANISNSLNAVNIVNLAGTDCTGADIEKFEIITLPNASAGILYMADGVTAVTVGQTLTREEADGLRFNPTAGFVGDASFTYVAIDGNNIEDPTPATVSIPVVDGAGGACTEAPTTDNVVNPNLLNTLSAVNILNLSGKDCLGNNVESFEITTLPNASAGILYMADGVTAVTVGQILTREEADGLKFDPVAGFVGEAMFTYASIDSNGNKDATPASVIIPLTNVLAVTDIVTNPDTARAHGNADPITINVLANDTGTLNGARVHLLNADGTLTDRLVVDGEGVWNVNADNTITFTPVAPFVGTPTSVRYLVEDANGARSNSSIISITGQCVCNAYESSVPSLSKVGLFMMFLLTLFMGTFFMKKEI